MVECHNTLTGEVTVLVTQETIETLAGRIERAYRLRRSGWYRGCSTSRVWTTAAAFLVQLHQDDPTIPIDPELFVAVQPDHGAFQDPWNELIRPVAARRYRDQVRGMIRGLRAELRAEVRSAERRLRRGEAIDAVFVTRKGRLSPLGCYIVAVRAGCDDLAERFRVEAVKQHRSCPLYRQASLALLPAESYPVGERSVDEELVALTRHLTTQPNLN
jgi:hypothetical protein